MRPQTFLRNVFESKALADFERMGFSFDLRKMELRRERDQFIDKVAFIIDGRSDSDTCRFTTFWSVESERFLVDHERVCGFRPESALIAGSQDWLLRGWPRSALGFHLLNTPERVTHEMRELSEGAKLVGAKFLESITSFERAAESWLENGLRTDLTCALLIIAGQADRARRILDATIAEIDRRNLSGKAVALAQFRKTHALYFGKGDL
jgi:hypothetical protein